MTKGRFGATKTMTWNEVKAIQDEQMARYASILKPEIHAVLAAKMDSLTREFTERDTEVDFDYVSEAIPRGTEIENIFLNWSNDMARFQTDKNSLIAAGYKL